MQKAFIETQFPIARLSAESFNERDAKNGQTLPRLGRWWGRKPLILVRACIIGMLMPASDDKKKDRDIFLKILTMDDDGAWMRQKGDIPVKAWREAAPPEIQDRFFGASGFLRGITEEDKEKIILQIWENIDSSQRAKLDSARKRPVPQRDVFDAMPYPERIKGKCERPENIEGPSREAWAEINKHLKTSASSLTELVDELGQRCFEHTPKIGDAFCGGGSIPFEAARIGCQTLGSDLNPVAGILTWGSLNILGASSTIQEQANKQLEAIYKAADSQIKEWGVEHNEKDERADAYLYCIEVKPDGCDYYIPLAPSWEISGKQHVVVKWKRRENDDRLDPVVEQVSSNEYSLYKQKKFATISDGRIIDPFDPGRTWSLESVRGPEGLALWEGDDTQPRPQDTFQERLYCIRWVNARGERRYAAPTNTDLECESKVTEKLSEYWASWQEKGFIPSRRIPESGAETARLFRERGWTHWHHLFNPRQLLTNGLLAEQAHKYANSKESRVASMLALGKALNMNARLCRWHVRYSAIDKGEDVFSNQALNPLFNYCCRSLSGLQDSWNLRLKAAHAGDAHSVLLSDARDIDETCDFWITDPPYADAINYHELGDFFLSWHEKKIATDFSEWNADSRAELAVRGNGEDFRRSMVEIYRNLSRNMPNDGGQIVMFTHQNPAVWADLGMILWAAGLKATAAWTISTETAASGLKKGNYVQGTVCLVLRKRTAEEPGFLFDIYPMVEDEVRSQIASMQALDDGAEPNFNDSDYQLAAYAAALKVLTQYSSLDGKSVVDEVFAVRAKNQKSDFEEVIERAITIACDALIPKGLNDSWRDLSLIERYYLRALDIESRGERRKGMYEELARGFGVSEIKPLLKSDTANGTRVHTPSGFGTSLLAPIEGAVESAAALPRRGRASASGPHPFAASPLRHLLFAICETAAADNDPNQGRQYLRDTFGQTYWGRRESTVRLLDWLAALGNSEDTADWAKDSEAARILAGRLRNDDA
jgi:adenine-specific DNA methylase